MAMAASEIEALIKAALPDARVTVEDLAGDGDHYAATVVSETFRGIPRVKQHQIVYAALRGRMGGELHALALQTSAPGQSRTNPIGAHPHRRCCQWLKCSNGSRPKSGQNPVMLYMKGTPMFPQCGFSARVVQILTHLGVPFNSANVLEDMELREGDQGVIAVADHPAALCRRRVRRRLRHHHGDVPVRRAGDAAGGEGRSHTARPPETRN